MSIQYRKSSPSYDWTKLCQSSTLKRCEPTQRQEGNYHSD